MKAPILLQYIYIVVVQLFCSELSCVLVVHMLDIRETLAGGFGAICCAYSGNPFDVGMSPKYLNVF